MLPDATPEQSVSNLYTWLDNVMIGLGFSSSLAMAPNGQRIPGVFHHLGKEEWSTFRGHLGNLTRHWHLDCLTNNLSAGQQVNQENALLSFTTNRSTIPVTHFSLAQYTIDTTEMSHFGDEFFLFTKDNDTREATYLFSFRDYQRCSNSQVGTLGTSSY